jgi:Beta-galactosidase
MRIGSAAMSLLNNYRGNPAAHTRSVPSNSARRMASVFASKALPVFSIALAALAIAGTARAKEIPKLPRGVFSLAKLGAAASPDVLSNPSVTGISIRQPWRKIEPSKGNYDWTFLDSEVARAEKAGKLVLLHIPTEGPSTPPWVFEKGVQTFTYEDHNPYHKDKAGRIAVYWDETYLGEKKALIEAAGKHFASRPAVRVVAAVCVSSHGGDWNVPHTPVDVKRWREIGFTAEKVLGVCKQIIDVTMQSFPSQFVTLAVNPSGRLEPGRDELARRVVQYAREQYPGRFIVQKNSLAAVTPMPGGPDLQHYQLLWDSRPDIAGQMLWFSYGDATCRNNGRSSPCDAEATLRKAIDVGAAYGMKYIEVYEQDVLHQPAVIRYAHDRLIE